MFYVEMQHDPPSGLHALECGGELVLPGIDDVECYFEEIGTILAIDAANISIAAAIMADKFDFTLAGYSAVQEWTVLVL